MPGSRKDNSQNRTLIPRPSALWSFSHFAASFFFRHVLGLRIQGSEYLPLDRAFILAPNHQNNFDPPVAAFSIYPRMCYFLAKKELFLVHPLYSAILTLYNSIKIDRTGKDLSAIKKALSVLNKGYVLMVFPEGTRKIDNQLEEIKSGAAFLSIKTKVPLVPCFIKYKNSLKEDMLKGKMRVDVKFGKPIHPFSGTMTASRTADTMAAIWKKQMKELCR